MPPVAMVSVNHVQVKWRTLSRKGNLPGSLPSSTSREAGVKISWTCLMNETSLLGAPGLWGLPLADPFALFEAGVFDRLNLVVEGTADGGAE